MAAYRSVSSSHEWLKLFVHLSEVNIPDDFVGFNALHPDLAFVRGLWFSNPYHPELCLTDFSPYCDQLPGTFSPVTPVSRAPF